MSTRIKLRCWDILPILLLTVPVSRSENNISVRKSVATSSNQDAARWPASAAVDGDIRQEIKYCAHTLDDNQLTAWWRVDFGQLMTINYITIYYRDLYQLRFAGYQLYLSNTTESPTQGVLCFEDKSSTKAQVQLLVTHQCPYVARYVIVYNYRNNPIRYTWYYEYAVLELCEVQVYGCQVGQYGDGNCNSQCSGNCYGGNCNSTTGSCFYCFPGKYGDYCNNDCSTNCKDSTCEKDTGYCSGCIPGKKGDMCNTNCSSHCVTCKQTSDQCFECVNGKHGDVCDLNCSDNCEDKSCMKDNGYCLECVNGKHGDVCDLNCSDNCKDQSCMKDNGYCLECVPGKHGNECASDCSDNCKDKTCMKNNGNCTGCITGKTGALCDTNCSSYCETCDQTSEQCFECVNGKHGDVCDLNCSDHCKDKSCMKDNGYCLECVPGKHGNVCASDCTDNCKNKTCMKNNGHCTGCITGKAGALCDTNCSSYCETCDQTSEQCFECVNGKYGDVCDQGCPNDCKDQSCMKDNGYCSDCPVGKYGLLCNNSCSETCLNNICNARSGTCEVKETTSLEPQPGNTGVIVGVVVAGLLLVITITITLFLIRRRKQNSAKQDSFDDISRKNVSRTSHYNDGYEPEDYSTEPVTEQGNVYEVLDVAETESLTGQRNVYTNASNVEIVGNDIETLTNNVYVNANDVDKDSSRKVCKEAGPASTCIAISDLKALVKTKRINNAKAFEDEYQELPSKAIHEHNIGKLDEHRLKNRFKSTFPYDHSRVILDKLDNDSHSDYINANYIDSVISPAEYIATQGPTDITVDDLWRMIWQLKSRKIVMLTNLIEGTRKKCAKYWPDEGEPMSTKHFEIVLDRERIYAFYVIRDIILTEKKTKSVRQIHQFHYTTWPDHGTPDPNELVVFHRRVKHYNNILTGKLIVHCSAGIGRTGTFIALDALFEYGKENGVVDVMEFVRTMRKDRVNMVQTSDQYIAIHNLLIEAFDMPDTLVPRMKYHTTLKCLCDDAPVNQTKLWGEYKLIQDIKPTYTENDYKTATIPANRNKNRDPNILAVDKFRPYLSSSSFGRTDYINAVEIPSYKSRTGYIVTQTPLKDTVVDLLTLIMDRDCDTLVIIENDQMKWLPEEGNDKSIGSFKLRHGGGSSSLTNTDLIDVSISNQEQRYDARIRVFQITGWDRHESVPPDSPGLLQLLELLDSRRRSNDSKKTVVMCRDGNSQSGLFCCISNARDQMKIDEEVDIFQIARQLLFRRPEFITNYDQYKCCYHMIKEYLDTTDVYMN